MAFACGIFLVSAYPYTLRFKEWLYHTIFKHHVQVRIFLEKCVADVKERGVKGVNLITAGSGALPGFYEKHGFRRERRVILMGKEL